MKNFTTLLLALFSAISGFSATYYVSASRPDDSGVATNWATAKQTIQAAVDLTSDGDTVLVTNGVYDTGGTITPGYSLTNRVYITNAITVQSLNGPDVTSILGSPWSEEFVDIRGVYMTNHCSLTGFTIAKCQTMRDGACVTDRSGGGIWLSEGCLVSNSIIRNNFSFGYGAGAYLHTGGIIADCTIEGNVADFYSTLANGSGGGIYSRQNGEINNCEIVGNWGTHGGGIYLQQGGAISNCTITYSLSQRGAGVYLANGGSVYNSTISNNTASAYGGGMYLASGGLIDNCIITSNEAAGAAGVYMFSGTMNKSIISDNFASGSAVNGYGYGGGAEVSRGGILNDCQLKGNRGNYGGAAVLDDQSTINNSLISCNQAIQAGGALLHYGGILNNCTITGNYAKYGGGIEAWSNGGKVCNSIIWGNTSPNMNDIRLQGAVTFEHSCSTEGFTHGVNGCIIDNPLFVNSGTEQYKLQTNSPCINAGHNSYVSTTTDLDDNPRTIGGVVDMGAYEQQDAGTDVDADGIDDLWEMNWFDTRYNVDASSDHDGDGQSDHHEYIAGVDPTNAASFFSITGFTNTPFSVIGWNSVSGRIYSVNYCTNLIDGFEPLVTNIPWTVNTFTDSVHNTEQKVFYQISVEMQ